jgi:hypothetical protein
MYDSEGLFQIDREALKEHYSSLLEDDWEAVLFFAQSAHKWNALDLKLRVLKNEVQVDMRLPSDCIAKDRLLPDPKRSLEALFPHDHPLFEIAQGFNILTYSELTRRIGIYFENELLCIRWEYEGKEFVLTSRRLEIWFVLLKRILFQVPGSLDGKSQRPGAYPSKYVHYHFSFGETSLPIPVVACEKDGLRVWSIESERVQAIEPPSMDNTTWMLQTEQDDAPLLLNHLPDKSLRVYFYNVLLASKHASIVPVRYGVTLEAIPLEKSFGPALVFVNVDHLSTDISGLKLVQDVDYEKTIQEVKSLLRAKIAALKLVQEQYQPQVDRQKLLREAAKVGVLTPITLALGIALGGAGVILKSALTIKILAGTSSMGLMASSRSLISPDHYTQSTRERKLGWIWKIPDDPG